MPSLPFTLDGSGNYSIRHQPEWTEFEPGSKGTSRVHVVALNWRPGETDQHLTPEALCGVRVDFRKTVGEYWGKPNCRKCLERRRSIARFQFNYASDEDRAYMSPEALRAYHEVDRQIDQVRDAVERDAQLIRAEIIAARA